MVGLVIDWLCTNVVAKKIYTKSITEAIKVEEVIFIVVTFNEFDKYIEIALIKWGITVV